MLWDKLLPKLCPMLLEEPELLLSLRETPELYDWFILSLLLCPSDTPLLDPTDEPRLFP